MKTWNEYKLGKVCNFEYGKSLPERKRIVGTYPVYGSSSMVGLHNKYIVKGPGIIVGRKGTVGAVQYVKDNFFPIDTTFYVLPKRDHANLKFLYYKLKTFGLEQMNSDAAVPGLNRKATLSLVSVYPSKDEQLKIAAVLSAYDDLIENNNRRIALLEKMAEELYREWFVRMRFPEHEKTNFNKGIPEGWNRLPISQLCAETKNSMIPKKLHRETYYLGLEHLPRKSITIPTPDKVSNIQSNKLKFQKSDILFGKIRPYLHKIGLADFDGICSSDTIILRPETKNLTAFLLFTFFSETFVDLATVASKGTKMPRADWDFLKKQEITVPNEEFLELFQNRFEQSWSLICNLKNANKQAITSRDMLLSRLISGKLSVEELNIRFPASMQEASEESLLQEKRCA